MPYAVVDADEVELGRLRLRRRRLAPPPVAGPDGLAFVAGGARPQESWEPDF